MSLEAQSLGPEASGLGAEAAPSAAAIPPAFEQILHELEALVTQLESGDLPLDEALRTFERGVRLTRECQAALSAAQQKVQLLLQRGDSAVLQEFDRSTVATVTGVAGESAASIDP